MTRQTPIALDAQDRALINNLQDGFPLSHDPFAEAGAALGLTGAEVRARLGRLLDDGVLTRFGPMFDAAAMGGGFSLCALSVPAPDYDRIAGIVNGFDQVAHNYARDHDLNMWFVIAAETEAEISETVAAIERETGLLVYDFPKLEEYHISARFRA